MDSSASCSSHTSNQQVPAQLRHLYPDLFPSQLACKPIRRVEFLPALPDYSCLSYQPSSCQIVFGGTGQIQTVEPPFHFASELSPRSWASIPGWDPIPRTLSTRFIVPLGDTEKRPFKDMSVSYLVDCKTQSFPENCSTFRGENSSEGIS